MKKRARARQAGMCAAVIMVFLLGWISVDLYKPRPTDIRRFDPNEVARLDTAMWRSYYKRERLRLFLQLGQLLRTQYHLPFWKSIAVAYHAARAAFMFKDGSSRAEYERALPNLIDFYAAIHEASSTPFDVSEVARRELEWWIVHRERRHPAGALERALAETAAAMYRMPAERMMEHARLRAEAMLIRDREAEDGDVTEEDWRRIEELLHDSWRSLHTMVNS
ncbi:MAG: hypothetical protein LC770_06300 [Acidobacteria bacterium]|nr:hypothetical protein [Acidobacteriota bacterium]